MSLSEVERVKQAIHDALFWSKSLEDVAKDAIKAMRGEKVTRRD